MSGLGDLYQEIILDHNKNPRNFREMPGATHHADGYNPLCGDRVTVYLHIEDGRVADVSFKGSGCAISTASASLMTQTLKGKTVEEADALFERFQSMVTTDLAREPDTEGLGKLAALAGVREFPTRIKCATLVWHTVHSALHRDADSVTTE